MAWIADESHKVLELAPKPGTPGQAVSRGPEGIPGALQVTPPV